GKYYESGGQWKPELLAEPHVETVSFVCPSGTDIVIDAGERLAFDHSVTATSDSDLTPGFFVRRGGKYVVETTYARVRGHPLRLRAGETASVRWSLAFNLPAGVYEVGYHVRDIDGGYHDYKNRACTVTVGDDPRVKGEVYVALELSERMEEAEVPDVTLQDVRSAR
ncbi:MAG: Wzt carbohydrate-binding domain-containing protein, partial [Gemmatimonadota bacterium]|nr:Wzt carbohydrate-binding domain-containing protein [Gemmatimonadota bacterium]